MVRAQPTSEERQEAKDLEDLVANLELPSVEALEDGGALTLSIAFLSAEHLKAGEALTPIVAANAADQGVSAITWPRLLTATKASPICQQLIKLI